MAAIIAVALGGPWSVLPAQTPSSTSSVLSVHDDRWQPWLGCWSPTGNITPMQTVGVESLGSSARSLLCVVPGSTPTSVDVVNFSGGTIVDRTVLEPGRAVAKKIDDCSGSETATWSADGNRLMLKGTFTCAKGVQRVESGIMSIDVNGEWVQAQSINVSGNVTTFVAHFRDTGIALEGIANGALVERPLLDETGKRISPPRDACTGTEAVTPSQDGSRVTVKSDFTCAGGLRRVADAEFIRGANGQWVRSGGPGVLFSTPSVRAAAGAPVQTTDVMEVAKAVEPTVVEAWLSDRNQQFELTGKELVRLADGGMPPRVLDMMVAISNPRTFTLRRPGTDAGAEEGMVGAEPSRIASAPVGCAYAQDYCYGMTGLGWLYGADRYYGWGPYGYQFNRYGYGNGWGWGNGGFWGPGYYNGGGPIVVIGNPQPQAPRGRAVFGQGYTRERPITYTAPSSGSGGGTSSPSAGSPAGSGSGSSSGSSGGGRTAKPRGGGGE